MNTSLTWGMSVYKDPSLTDGKTMLATDLGATCLIVGTRQLTYVERTVRDITIDVFGEQFLRKIGAWEPTSEEVLAKLRKGGHRVQATA